MNEKIIVELYDKKPIKGILSDNKYLFIEKEKIPDSDQLILSDQKGLYRRVIVPENYFLFEKI